MKKRRRKPLTLKEYHRKYGTPLRTIADRCGIGYNCVWRAFRGDVPTIKTAYALKLYSKGEMDFETLIPPSEREDVEKKISMKIGHS